MANNELGTLQPVTEVSLRARKAGALVHLDACQGPRWLPVPLTACDAASFSGRKLGAGRGGAAWFRRDAEVRVEPLTYGGPQEWGLRGGPPDVGSAVAVATALIACAQARAARGLHAAELAGRLRSALEGLGARPTGADPRLPNYATAAFAGVRGEDLLLALDLSGVSASSGSACASGSLDPSHVLLAAGLSLEEALGSLRLTAGYESTAEEVDTAVETLTRVVGSLVARASA